jgi:hypothetical protein
MVSLMAHPSAAKRARGAAGPLAGGMNRQIDRDAFQLELESPLQHYGMLRVEIKLSWKAAR